MVLEAEPIFYYELPIHVLNWMNTQETGNSLQIPVNSLNIQTRKFPIKILLQHNYYGGEIF